MSRKSKGINAERELIHLFHSRSGWGAVRVAGSGSSHYPSPDVVASNSERLVAIECKSSKTEKKYIPKDDINQLILFGACFGAECWIGVRFVGGVWRFFLSNELENVGKNFVVSKEKGKNGISFDEFINRKV